MKANGGRKTSEVVERRGTIYYVDGQEDGKRELHGG